LSRNDNLGGWRESAACAQTDPELFFPSTGEVPRDALRVCAGCEVRKPCLAFALTQGTALDGVWGGTTTWHRRELLAGPNPEVARRQEAVDRYRRLGWAKPAIAFALGVSETTVARDLSILSRKAAS
jgi:WhiB family redox-sensing transcriptional regulator